MAIFGLCKTVYKLHFSQTIIHRLKEEDLVKWLEQQFYINNRIIININQLASRFLGVNLMTTVFPIVLKMI